jgi:hypothetical protein
VKPAKKKSNGTFGEQRAEWWFSANDWTMFRTQPATRVVFVNSKPTTINYGTGGIADYTGYVRVTRKFAGLTEDKYCYDYRYVAVEVKEFSGDSMPASRLDKRQRDWMAKLPGGCAWVMGVRPDGKCFVWEFKSRGSYKI